MNGNKLTNQVDELEKQCQEFERAKVVKEFLWFGPFFLHVGNIGVVFLISIVITDYNNNGI